MENTGTLILDCQVKECSYNRKGNCHTLSINVGGPNPECETFINAGINAGELNAMAKVGACKVRDCSYNDSLECIAEVIRIVNQNNQAMCGMYESNPYKTRWKEMWHHAVT